ncbi:zinc-dependent alcohol dehydrogenase [Ferviditalea candida]|uniref:Alcohol dehydrogenase catalytic domain-containing protein n=1 Tax=Ferviditalea candida TaxID=3108399 RepID=A0ABU5ZMW6_9BACL|nr:alcohol dehydrogenase catalytic domain-containing protein [Paenibacillaceae bacterium T2]
MKAIVKKEKKFGGIEVTEVPIPDMDHDEVLVRMHHASICGSDIHAYHYAPTHHFIEPPVIMGHEGSGHVEKVGSSVTGFRPGDRVVIEAIQYCGVCESCMKGKRHICNRFQIRGMHRDGVFSEYVAVKAPYLHKFPESLSYAQASLVEPVSVLTHAVLDRSAIGAGDVVLITGPGPIGILGAQMVKIAGAEPVVVGVEADEAVRMPISRSLGIKTINADRESIPEFLIKHYNRETVHAVVECSGAPSAFRTALDLVVKGGNITLVGLFAKLVEANLSNAVRKEISIHTSFSSDWENFERAIKLLDRGLFQIDPLVAHYRPDDAIQAFEDAIAKKVPKPMFDF